MGAALRQPASVSHPSVAHPLVIKLGGSIVRGGSLAGWLDVIADAKQPIVIVPGGGALADEVRQCQQQLGFGDVTAHRMALLAMDQLAWAIAGMRPGLDVGTTDEQLRSIVDRGLIAVWAPSALVTHRTDLEASWQLTSDSLAVWLAGELGAMGCFVVKSAVLPRGPVSAASLAVEGIVDEAFPGMLARTGVSTAIFGQGDEAALAACLGDPAMLETRVIV